jgi:hypothetical protein
MAERGWNRRFDEPIPTPKGKPLITLRNAAAYITALPKKEADAAEWQAASARHGVRAFRAPLRLIHNFNCISHSKF